MTPSGRVFISQEAFSIDDCRPTSRTTMTDTHRNAAVPGEPAEAIENEDWERPDSWMRISSEALPDSDEEEYPIPDIEDLMDLPEADQSS